MKIQSNCIAYRHLKIPLLFTGALLFLFIFSNAMAQNVVIPRDGFPYCEPFTGSTTRANTVFDGIPNTAILTANAPGINDGEGNGFLRLTNDDPDQRGYVFIDLPFSSAYGIKVSFEYFAYGGIDPAAAADGISFFMFDGDIGPNDDLPPFDPNTEFRIGGLGGSLGYSRWVSPSNPTNFLPGLNGAYIGIGFDAFRNWGNGYEGRNGGFSDPNAFTKFGPVPADEQFYNSIAVRGPAPDYQFIDGKRTYSRSFLNEEQPAVWTDPINPSYYLFESLSGADYVNRRFKIGSTNRAELCSQDGYRKVFIDLFPTGGGNYLLSVHMLVNNGGTRRIEPIFENLPYNFPAPDNLKIGFAASTGGNATNFHEIRNLVVEVSEISSAFLPVTDDKDFQICEDEAELEISFPITLPNPEAFIRCLQLFKIGETVPDNTPPTSSEPSTDDCGFGDSACTDLCDPYNFEKEVPGGTFIADLQPLYDNNIDLIGNEVQIKFVPDPDFADVGSAQIVYTVTDNFGLTSDPKTITVDVSPFPIKSQDPIIIYPTCDGQSDGTLTDFIVSDLVPGFDYEWFFADLAGNEVSIGKAGDVSPLVGDQASFDLQGLNRGTYTLSVWNPSDNGICERSFDFIIDQETGTPIELDLPSQTICEGDDVTFSPSIVDPSFGSDAGAQFFWYLSPDRVGGAIVSGSTINGVTYTIQSDRDLTISGLVSDGNATKTYSFYVEAQPTSNPSGNFCPYTGIVLTVGNVEVYPPLDLTASKDTDDWCLDNSGSITASVSNPTSSITYELLDDVGNVLRTQIDIGSFGGLGPGIYEVTASSSSPQCLTSSGAITIEGPSIPLTLNVGTTQNAFCNDSNGSLTFTLEGGTPDSNGSYEVRIDGQSISSFNSTITTLPGGENEIVVEDLAPGTYSIEVIDDNGCIVSISLDLTAQIFPEYELTDQEICVNETAEIQVTTFNPGTPNANPVFRWFKDASATEEIFDGPDASLELTFDIDQSTGRLGISDFINDGVYTFYLKPDILNNCDFPVVPVEVKVNPLPAPTFESTAVSCFAGSDGLIRLTGGGNADYIYSLEGNSNPFNSSTNQFENLSQGDYTVIGINTLTGCQNSFDLTIDEPTELLISDDSIINPSCQLDNGSFDFIVTGGTPDSNGIYDVLIDGQSISSFNSTITTLPGGENEIVVEDLAPGTYSIEVIDDNGCIVSISLDLTAQIFPEYELTDQEICVNETAEIQVTKVNPGTPNANPVFRWFKDASATEEIFDGPDTNLQVSFEINNVSGQLRVFDIQNPGTYTFFLKPDIINSCDLAAVEVNLNVNAIPEVNFESVTASCFGIADGEIRAISGTDPSYTYSLNTGETNATGVFTGLAANDYEITITDGIGCASVVDITVSEPALLEINALGSVDPTCGDTNGEIQFEISGGTPIYAITINGNSIDSYSYQENGNVYKVQELSPDTYSISVSDNNSCVVSANNLFTLVNNDGIDIVSLPMNDEICESGIVQLIPDLTIPSGASPVLKWYLDAAASQEIISDSNPAADGNIYEISANSSLSIQNLSPGSFTYYLIITGSGICTQVTEATVVVDLPVSATVEQTQVPCFGGNGGEIRLINPTGGDGVYEYSIDGSTWQSSGIFSSLIAGIYQVRMRDGSGNQSCRFEATVNIEQPDNPISLNTPDVLRSSCGLDNGAIRNLVVSGGWGQFTFEWRKDDPISGALLTQGTLTGIEDLAPGDYYLIVTDLEGCTEQFDFEIEVSSDPVYALVDPIDVCFGQPIPIRPIHLAPDPSLPPASETEVRWYLEPGQSGLISSGPDVNDPSIIYSIDDTDWLNPELVIDNLPVGVHDFYFYVVCTGQEIQVDIEVFAIPEVIFETDPVSCFGGSDGKIRAVSGDNANYLYTLNGGPTISLQDIENMDFASGIYDIEVITPAGCPQVIALNVEGPSAPLSLDALSQFDPGCGVANGRVIGEISGGWAPYRVEIYQNGTLLRDLNISGPDFEFDGLVIGDYSLEIIDEEGCRISGPTLTLIDGPTQILVDNQEICLGESVTLSPSLDPDVPVSTYFWSFDQAGTNIIQSSPNPAADGIIYQINSDGELTISGLSSSAQPYTYYVTAEGPGICLGFLAEPKVTVLDAPTATITTVAEQCFGDGGSISINASGGDGSYEYSIDGVNFQSSNTFDVPAGSYEVFVSSGNGCLFSQSGISVVGPSEPISISNLEGRNSSCNLANGQISFSVNGGYGDYSVDIFLDGINIGSAQTDTNGDILIGDLSIGEYSFEIRDSSGCLYLFDNPLELVEEPTQILIDDVSICEGESAVLSPEVNSNSPNLTFSWYFDEEGNNPISSGTNGGVSYDIASTGELTLEGLTADQSDYSYYVLAEGIGVCGLEPVQVTVSVEGIPELRVSNPSIVCNPAGTVDLTDYIEGFNPNVYDYNVLNPAGSAMLLDELSDVRVSGDYRVSSALKGSSCYNEPQRIRVLIAETELIANFEYEADLGGGFLIPNAEIQIQEDVNFQDLSQGDVLIWDWNFGDGTSASSQNPVHQYQEKGTYTVRLTTIDSIGCISTYEVIVEVLDDYVVMIPNAFTPTGTKNMTFRPYYRGIASMEFYIFNTWGELIYETNSMEDPGWDGTLNGKAAPNGNYVFRGRFLSRSGETVNKSGVFILIR